MAAAWAKSSPDGRIEVEVESREQVEEALAAGVDIIYALEPIWASI